MSEQRSRKIPVTDREFLWVQDDDKGEVVLHVGPTMVSPTAADRVVAADGAGGFREGAAPQKMVEVGDAQYAVLANPLAEPESDTPNGTFRQGRNEARALRNGTRAMIPGPCSFYLRPGQRCEVRDAHELASDQYLVVRVDGEVDTRAPCYEITARSAGITTFTAETPAESTPQELSAPVRLIPGQLIVIRGVDVQRYSPPSGVDVVPDPAQSPPEATLPWRLPLDDDEDAQVELLGGSWTSAPTALSCQGPLVRQAVVLGEKEFCVVIDADGKRSVEVGPARVFPGPYDRFQTEGSRDRVYDAYQLFPHRALWLRAIAPLSRDEIARHLPVGLELTQDRFHPGDELLLTGVSGFFFPFNEVDVLDPKSGQALVGNDHSRAFVEAIGIDQKSGIYVRDLRSGEVRLVRGKQSYLVRPGEEVHVHRTLPADDWNQWIAVQEPHKRTESATTTPWAISVRVPHNAAVLATSADGQRVIEGPCVELLEYGETLACLTLSTRTPKTDAHLIRTCFLRTLGNRVSDVIRVQTADFVEVDVRVSYHVTFKAELRERWFNQENYVQVLVEHLRSLVRSRLRTRQLAEVWSELPQLVRTVILGEKVEGEHRPGRLFEESGMLVQEVEVLTAEILDPEIAALYQQVQREIVSLQIGDRQAQAQGNSARLRADLDAERMAIERDQRERKAELEQLIRQLAQQAQLARIADDEAAWCASASAEGARELVSTRAEWERTREAQQVELALLGERAQAEATAERTREAAAAEGETARHRLALEQIQARAQATVAEHTAVQPGLVEALTGLGDRQFLTEAARNMNLVSLFKGKDVGSLLQDVLGGTRVAQTLRNMKQRGAKNGG